MRPPYSTGMSQPPKSTILALWARWVALSAVVRSFADSLEVAASTSAIAVFSDPC